MGGKNVYSDLRDCIRTRHCNEMKGSMYAVDFTYQLYRIMIGIKNKKRTNEKKVLHDYLDMSLIDPDKTQTLDELIDYEDDVAHIIATCTFVETCAEKNIFMIPVFDGKAPDIKRKKLDERKKIQRHANEECSKIEDKTSDDYIRQHKKTVRLRDNHFKETIELLKAMGLPTVQAPGEAESQCAAMALCLSDIDGVISEDSDILLFGGPKIIKNFNRKNNTFSEIKLFEILKFLKLKANKILKAYLMPEIVGDFKEEWFIDSRILFGTDYNEPVSGINSNKLFELFVVNGFDVPKLVNQLQQLKLLNCAYAESYLEIWTRVKEYYLGANVIDPLTLDVSLKEPNYKLMVECLHTRNNFKISYVNKIYNELMQMYKLNYNMPYNSNWYNNFRSYQVKFHSNKTKKYYQPYYNCKNYYDQQDKVKRIIKYVNQ